MNVFEYQEKIEIVLALKAERKKAAKNAWFMRGERMYASFRDTYSKARALHIKADTAFVEGAF